MPKDFTDDDLYKRKQEIEDKLRELDNQPKELDEISEDDDKEEETYLNSEVDEGSDTDNKELQDIEDFNYDFIKEMEKQIESSESEEDFEIKVNNVINKRKELKIYTQDVDTLINNLEDYMSNIYDKLDKKNRITKGDLNNLDKEYKSIMDEFEIEYDKIINDMPKELNFTKTYTRNINKKLDKIEDKFNNFIS